MRIGDKISFTPSGFEGEVSSARDGQRPKPCQVMGVVAYIHPERRYFTLTAVVNGCTIRESFKFKTDIKNR